MQGDHRLDIAGKQIVNHVRVLLQSHIVPLTFMWLDSTPFNGKPVMANAQCFNEIEIGLPAIPMVAGRTAGLDASFGFECGPIVLIVAFDLMRRRGNPP